MKNKVLVTKSSLPPFEEYTEAIKPLWESHWITNMGENHRNLEDELRKYLGVGEVSLMVNGHMALELAIQSFGFPENSEVITTPFTFISTTHAIVRNHLSPVFCDIKEEDGTIDEEKIEGLITEKTVAILPVHVYGNVCNIEKIQEIAYKYGLKVIYDAAHAFGIKYKGKGIGSYGDASVFSFHATKVFNTIEGGAVTFQDKKMYEKLYNFKNFGIRGEELVTEVGANAKMNEFSAIMGLCNLKHIENTISERKKRYEKYIDALESVKGIRIFNQTLADNRNYAYFPIAVESGSPISRNGLYDFLKQNNIFTRKYFYPLCSDQACFKNKYKKEKLGTARNVSEHILVLPMSEYLSEKEQTEIIRKIKEYMGS